VRDSQTPQIVEGSIGAFLGAEYCKANSALTNTSVVLLKAEVVEDLGSSIRSTKFGCSGSKFWD